MYRMRLLLSLTCLLAMTSLWVPAEAITIESAFQSAMMTLEDMMAVVNDLKTTVKDLARQTMSQQLFVEERIRSDGNSGIKQIRTELHGTSSYFDTTHVGKGVSAIHDHSNYMDTIGMGETVVVINGVEFRTRHNDYKVYMKSTTEDDYHAVQHVPFPRVPREVTMKPTLDEQVAEMREWFKAFHNQDYTVRDYRQYFRPLLCYMEGAWTINENIKDPFSSDRHGITANSWEELLQQIRYTSYTGAKDINENFAYLPSTIIAINETTGKPVYAQWTYRILCHPFSGDIPTAYFRQQDDLSYRESRRRTLSKVASNRAARYRLSEYDVERFTGFSLIDKIMGEIPGANNRPQFLNEEPMQNEVFTVEFSNFTKLNTGYYHRMYKTNKAGAMGLLKVDRGFSDELLFVAETTDEHIAPMEIMMCEKRKCTTRSTRFTYAIPLEVIYMTPLLQWNPYDLEVWDKPGTVVAGGRKGSTSNPTKAYNGTCPVFFHYLTPREFYSGTASDEEDPADTVESQVGVLDKQGNIRITTSSGTRILTQSIRGIGPVRLRYPIPPIHGEGSTVWKELEVVKKKLADRDDAISGSLYQIKMSPTSTGGTHDHDFYMTQEEFDDVQKGQIVSVTTSTTNGHYHELDVWLNSQGVFSYKTCGNENICWDGHPQRLIIVSPGQKK